MNIKQVVSFATDKDEHGDSWLGVACAGLSIVLSIIAIAILLL